jgi:hypothetical protein
MITLADVLISGLAAGLILTYVMVVRHFLRKAEKDQR